MSALVVAACVTALAAIGLDAGIFAGFQRRATDALVPSAVRDDRIVVIGMDQKSIKRLGIPPWSRTVHAELAAQLAAYGVTTAVWDVVFLGPSADPAADEAFATSLAELPAPVLGVGVGTYEKGEHDVYRAGELSVPSDTLAQAGNTSFGHVLVTPDPADGVVRVVPVVVDDGRTILPSLALQALRASQGDDSPLIVRSDGIQVGDRFVPTEGEHLIRLNWAEGLDRGHSPQVISLVDVLDGTVDPSRLRGKIAFVGATEPMLGDSKLVPVDKSNTYPGRARARERAQHDAHVVVSAAGQHHRDRAVGRARVARGRVLGLPAPPLVLAVDRARTRTRVRRRRLRPVRRRACDEHRVPVARDRSSPTS